MKNARILMLVGIGLIGLILTDRQVLRAQGGSGTILFEPPPSFVAAPQTDPWARLSGVIPKEDLHGKSVNMIVVLRDHPFMRFVKEQGPPGKGLTSELRKELADKFRALYQDKLHREHERIIDQIWTLEKQRVKKMGGNPESIPRPSLRYEYFFLLNGFATTATYDLMSDIQKLGSVETVSVDRPLTPRLHETVPFLSARAAQNAGIDGSGRTIAILDTGIDWTHADLGNCTDDQFKNKTCPKVVGGCDLTKCPTCDPADIDYDSACVSANLPMDTQWHGTAVARVAAANRQTINGVDYSGVAPGATLMAYKVVGDGGGNGGGLNRAMDNIFTDGLTDVVNISMDVGCDNPPDMFGVCNSNSLIATLIKNATDAGLVVAVAVANGGVPGEFSRMSSPEFVPDAISVGATRKTDDVLASYTSNGPSWVCFVDSGPGDPDTSKCNPERGEILPTLKPDLVAPGDRGHGIYQDNICFSGSCSESAAGTSLASPHVAGAAALVLQSLNPQDTDLGARSRTVKAVLMESASFLPDGIARTPYEQGAGRLNVSTAVQVQAMVLPPSLNLGRANCGTDTVITVPLTLRNYRTTPTQFTLNFTDRLNPIDPTLWTVTFDGNPPPDYTVAVGPAPGPGCPPPGLGCPRVKIVTASFTLMQGTPQPVRS